jgi:hypothetical protein
VDNGINRSAAGRFGGGDQFWTTTDENVARTFAEVNPAEGEPAVVGIRVAGGTEFSLLEGAG